MISENVKRLMEELPPHGTLVVAAKQRCPNEVLEPVEVGMPHQRVKGLMIMDPRMGDPEEVRPSFRTTKRSYERLKRLRLPEVEMNVLSMGMPNFYRLAIDEGAKRVRIGSEIFGKRAGR